MNQNEERLQKALARAGIASRRACEELIAAGRVKVNGKIVTQLGTKIDPTTDKVTVDNTLIPIQASKTSQKIYLMLNKPAGYLSTVSDPQNRPTIMDLIETDQRLYPVGRLDLDTEGLLIITNDGNFANTLIHPRYGIEKEYVALLDGFPNTHDLRQLSRGVPIPVENENGVEEDYLTQPAVVELIRREGSNSLVRFVIKEGKKRQIRLMAQYIKHPVLELRRVRFGSLRLGDLTSGQTRHLSKAEISGLLAAATTDPTTKPKANFAQTSQPNAPTTAPRRYQKVDSGYQPSPAGGRSGNSRTDSRPSRGPSSGGSRSGNPAFGGGSGNSRGGQGGNSFGKRPNGGGSNRTGRQGPRGGR